MQYVLIMWTKSGSAKISGSAENPLTERQGARLLNREELQRYLQIFVQCHNIFLKYSVRAGTEKDCQELYLEVQEAKKKVQQNIFSDRVFCETLWEIERIWKEKKHETKL